MFSLPTPISRNFFAMTLKGSRICHPQIYHFGPLMNLSNRHLKNRKCRERLPLNPLHLPKDRTSQSNSAIINLLRQGFINQERLNCHLVSRPEIDTRQTMSQTITSLIYPSKVLFAFPKNYLLSLKRLHFPLHSLQRWYFILN